MAWRASLQTAITSADAAVIGGSATTLPFALRRVPDQSHSLNQRIPDEVAVFFRMHVGLDRRRHELNVIVQPAKAQVCVGE